MFEILISLFFLVASLLAFFTFLGLLFWKEKK
jgi:Tfp pilus assembly protein PilV